MKKGLSSSVQTRAGAGRSLWAPALFTGGGGATHRLLWLQHGLFTVLVYASPTVFQNPAPADVSEPHPSVSPTPTTALVATLQTVVGAFLSALDDPVRRFFARHDAVIESNGLSASPTLLASEGALMVLGVPGASRRTIGGSSAETTVSQASPLAASALNDALPRHLRPPLARIAACVAGGSLAGPIAPAETSPSLLALVRGANGWGRASSTVARGGGGGSLLRQISRSISF